MSKAKIVQVIPLPETKTIISADSTRKGNMTKMITGAALMDNGRVLPLIWDGRFSFETFDPVIEEFAEFVSRFFTQAEPMPVRESEYTKKMEALGRLGIKEKEHGRQEYDAKKQ